MGYFVKKAGKREWGLWLVTCLFLSFGVIIFIFGAIYAFQSSKFLEYNFYNNRLIPCLFIILFLVLLFLYIYYVNVKHRLLSSKYVISENDCKQIIKGKIRIENSWNHLTKIKLFNHFVKLHFSDGAMIVMFWGVFQDSIREMETINDNLKEKYDVFMMPFTRKSESKTLLIMLIIFAFLSIVLAFLTPTIANFIKNIE